MTRRLLGVAAVALVLTTTLAGCAGAKRSAVGTHPSIRQLRMREAAREARLRAKAEAKLAALAARRGGSQIPPIGETGAGHPQAAKIALRYLGVPYVWGGSTPHGFDSSGLVTYVYSQLGISLPHYTASQWHATEAIPRAQMKPGDLVFFNELGHVGIYIGNRQFVNAPHTGAVVRIDSLPARGLSFVGAGRVP